MNKKKTYLIFFLTIFLLLSGCSNEEKIDKEMNLIMDTLDATESNQYFYQLVNSLLANKQTSELLDLATVELEQSEKELESLTLKTQEAKNVKSNYEEAFKNRKKVISMIQNNEVNEETKTDFKNHITKAQESEYEAKEIIIKELNLKDIEK